MKRPTCFLLVILGVLLIGGLLTSLFMVQETETAIVTRFSRALPEPREPGLHIKFPWPVDKVIRLDRRRLVFDHEPTEFLTRDKKNVLVDCYALWMIDDPHTFLYTVRTREAAEARLLDMITAATGEVFGRYDLANIINQEEDKLKLDVIHDEVFNLCRDRAEAEYGLRLFDIRINSFNFPSQNRLSVIKRMQAERESIATQYRSEGEEEAMKIEAETDSQVRTLLAEARREAQVIRGEAEAEALRIYGDAYGKNPDFFELLRKLEVYESVLNENTTIFLPLDSPLWDVLYTGELR
ncbi:MAG: protease modulator HflC [Spirochaetales bacterium]|nr:protease modulator HflC [Spirochaetales bacterium]